MMMLEIRCLQCGRDFEVPLSRQGRRPKTCSARCRRARIEAKLKQKLRQERERLQAAGLPVPPAPRAATTTSRPVAPAPAALPADALTPPGYVRATTMCLQCGGPFEYFKRLNSPARKICSDNCRRDRHNYLLRRRYAASTGGTEPPPLPPLSPVPPAPRRLPKGAPARVVCAECGRKFTFLRTTGPLRKTCSEKCQTRRRNKAKNRNARARALRCKEAAKGKYY